MSGLIRHLRRMIREHKTGSRTPARPCIVCRTPTQQRIRVLGGVHRLCSAECIKRYLKGDE